MSCMVQMCSPVGSQNTTGGTPAPPPHCASHMQQGEEYFVVNEVLRMIKVLHIFVRTSSGHPAVAHSPNLQTAKCRTLAKRINPSGYMHSYNVQHIKHTVLNLLCLLSLALKRVVIARQLLRTSLVTASTATNPWQGRCVPCGHCCS